jgi:hypothetical protein
VAKSFLPTFKIKNLIIAQAVLIQSVPLNNEQKKIDHVVFFVNGFLVFLILAASIRRESLRDMFREAGIWRSGNKRALAAGLLNWRDRCRAHGKAFLTEMHSLSKSRPQQLTLRFSPAPVVQACCGSANGPSICQIPS